MPTYQEMLEEGRRRDAELDAHVLTAEELERIDEEARPYATGEAEVATGHTYCVGGNFRDEDGVIRVYTRSRNVSASSVRRKLVAYAMQENTVRVEFWIEAF